MSNQEYSNLLDFILKREEHIVLDLLKDVDACRTFIRLLSPLSQHFLFRMLMIPEPLELSSLRAWAPQGCEHELNQAFKELQKCHFFVIEQLPREVGVQLHPDIRSVLLHGNINPSNGFQTQTHPVKSEFPFQPSSQSIFPQKEHSHLTNLEEIPYIEPETLDNFSADQLDKILKWMLGLSDKINPQMRQLLRDSNLITMDNNLTKSGHQFVLTDRRSQIWLIVRSYLSSFLKNSPQELISALRFILKLGSLQFTRGYHTSILTDTQMSLLMPFCSLGLIYTDNSRYRDYFFPTRVVLNFFGKEQLDKSEGWILIDTNFKITAYTNSELHVALLKKFSYITYQMPGFTSAYISPKKLKEALDEGTSLDDILTFLRLNICTTKGEGKIPADVEHQLQVWKNQRERITTTQNCIMRTYQNRDMADAARAIAEEMIIFVGYFQLGNGQIVVVTTEEREEEYSRRLKQLR